MSVISKVIRDGRGFFRMLTGLVMDGQTADPTADPGAALLFYRGDTKRVRFQDDAGTFTNLAREDQGTFQQLAGTGAAPTVAVGNAAQLGTGPAAAITGTGAAMKLTITPGTTPTIFTANTPVILGTITLPAAMAAVPNSVGITAQNQQAAQSETGANGICVYCDPAASSATQLVIKAVSAGTPTLTASTALIFGIQPVG